MEIVVKAVMDIFREVYYKAMADYKSLNGASWFISFDTLCDLYKSHPSPGLEINGGMDIKVFGLQIFPSNYHEYKPLFVEAKDFIEEPNFTVLLQQNLKRYGDNRLTYYSTDEKYEEMVSEYKSHYQRLLLTA